MAVTLTFFFAFSLFALVFHNSCTQFAIVFFASIILTLRVAYYELDEVVYDENETSNGCCGSGKKKGEEKLELESDDDDDDDDDDDE
jgi:hypothetical protein